MNSRGIGFDAFYCVPGEDGAHEKGGVEHEGGRFRRTHLVPVPEVATLEELNAKIAEIDAAEDERILAGRLTTVGFNFYTEVDQLTPLPLEEFECGITLTPKVDRSSRITVRQCHYSVPEPASSVRACGCFCEATNSLSSNGGRSSPATRG